MSVWKSDETLLSICILNFSFKNDFVWEEISNIRHSVSSPDETPRSSSKILRCASYFQLSSRCFIWWWNTASHVWYITWRMQIFQWLLPVLVTPLMKGQAWKVCLGTQAKTGHFCSLFFGNSLTFFIKDAFDWPYSGIRIRKIFVANLLDKSTVIFGPLKRCIHRDILFQADFWILQCNEGKLKQVISRVNSFYSYHSRIQTRPFVLERVWRWRDPVTMLS